MIINAFALVDWGPPCEVLARGVICCSDLAVTVSHDVPDRYLQPGVPARVYLIPDIVAALGPGFTKVNPLLVPSGLKRMVVRPGTMGTVRFASPEKQDDYALIVLPDQLPPGVQCLPRAEAASEDTMFVVLLGARDFVPCRWADKTESAVQCYGGQREAILLDDKGAWFGWSGSPVVSTQGSLVGIVARKGKERHERICISPAWNWKV